MLIQTQQQQTIKTSKNKQTRGRDYNYYHLFQSFSSIFSFECI